MGHIKINGVYYVKRSTYEKLKGKQHQLTHDYDQLKAHYSQLLMECEHNEKLKIDLKDKLNIAEQVVEQKKLYLSPEVCSVITVAGVILGLLIGIRI